MGPILQSSLPWVEKYSISAHQDEVVRVLINSLETGSCPHMLFYGPLASENLQSHISFSGLSYTSLGCWSSMQVMTVGLTLFVQRLKISPIVAVGTNQCKNGYPCPPFKIIVLDEADSLTEDAQNALRHTMETYSEVT